MQTGFRGSKRVSWSVSATEIAGCGGIFRLETDFTRFAETPGSTSYAVLQLLGGMESGYCLRRTSRGGGRLGRCVRGQKKVCVPKIGLKSPAPLINFNFCPTKKFLILEGGWAGQGPKPPAPVSLINRLDGRIEMPSQTRSVRGACMPADQWKQGCSVMDDGQQPPIPHSHGCG